MIQLFPRIQTLVSFGAATTMFPTFAAGTYSQFHSSHSRFPMPWAATVRNFVLSSGDTSRAYSVTVTLLKDAAFTSLSATLGSAESGPVLGAVADVDFAQYEDSMLWWVAGGASGGNTYGWCLEVESQGNIYGIPASQFGAAAAGVGGVAGAFGNGFWQSYSTGAGPFTESTSFSICATPGDVTRLVMRTYATPPPIGSSWIGMIRKNLVNQDGTGGTVDTRCEIVGDGSNDRAQSSFTLPCVKGDIVEVIYYRTGAGHPNETPGQIGAGIGFMPTSSGYYMLTGGSNNTLTADPGFVWILSAQNETDETLAAAPIGPGGLIARGLYIIAPPPGSDPDDVVVRTLRNSAANTAIAVGLTQSEGTGVITNQFVPFHYLDTITILQTTAGSSPNSAALYWGLEVGPPSGQSDATGVIGPLVWTHLRRRIAGSPSTSTTDSYSDIDMQCPSDWENGFKEGLVQRWGDVERPASHLFSGDWQGSTCQMQIAEKQSHFRAQLASVDDRYWMDATVRMTNRENRAIRGDAYTVFTGPVIDAQPSGRGVMDITCGDVVSQGMLSDQAQVPWRQIRDGFLSQMEAVSENLDRDAPEPILYGELIREATEPGSPTSDDGIRVQPIYLGIMQNDGLDFHVWLVCGHAVKDIEIFVDDVQQIELPVFSTWLIPHHSEFQSEFGAPYQDFISDTYGTVRRYTLIWGNVGRTNPDACATGEKTLTAAVWGVESEGDGTGTLITDRFQQYKHFLINYVANAGPESYQSGFWLSNPVWDLFDGPVEKVDEASFDAATVIGLTRTPTGYLGAAAIGIGAGDRASAKKWIADWNRSCACRFIVTHTGQMRIFLLHPTQALKDAAILYTDAWEILEDSFRTELAWDEHATAIHYKADFDPVTNVWITNGVEEDITESTNYGRTIPSEPREYPFAPGLQAQHLAILEKRIRKHPPRYVRLSGTIGPDPVTDESLGYREGGDYIRYVHFDAVDDEAGSPSGRTIRMAQVVTPGISVGSRVTHIVAMDCEDLIGYDEDGSPGAP